MADRDDEILAEVRRLNGRVDAVNRHLDILSGRQVQANIKLDTILRQIGMLMNEVEVEVDYEVEVEPGQPGDADIIHFPKV